MNAALPEDNLAEVLVGRQKNSRPIIRLLEHFIVGDTGRTIGYIDDIMTSLSQLIDNPLINAFVSDDIHCEWLVTG